MTRAEWIAQAAVVRGRASRIRAMRRERLERLSIAAGLGRYNGSCVHNAALAAAEGRPWRNVDPSLLRATRRLADSLCDADDLASQYLTRTMPGPSTNWGET